MSIFDNEDLQILLQYCNAENDISIDVKCIILANIYYQKMRYDKLKKFCDLSLKNETGGDVGMHIMGRYYKQINDIENMKQCYDIAILKNNVNAMNDMAYYYRTIELNIDEMKKYYGKAIQQNDLFAMIEMIKYYYDTEINYDEFKKYTLMAINNGWIEGVNVILAFYINNTLQIDANTIRTILPYSDKINVELPTKLYIVENCIINHICTKVYDIEIFECDTVECDLCTESKNFFIKTKCDHIQCTDCFVQIINKLNVICPFCRRDFIITQNQSQNQS